MNGIHVGAGLIAIAGILVIGDAARADNFGSIYYDPHSDRIVVTMIYRGTNPNHDFTLHWGRCKTVGGGQTIGAEVLDSQFKDAAEMDFTTTKRFSLAGMASCRPAKLTLRTAPRFYYSLQIPAAPAGGQ